MTFTWTDYEYEKFKTWWYKWYNFDLFGGTWRDALCCQVAQHAWEESRNMPEPTDVSSLMPNVSSIGKLLAGMLVGGGVTSISSAIDTIGKIILRLTEDDPVKRQKVLREYYMSLYEIGRGVRASADTIDASEFAIVLTKLLDNT